MEEQEGPSRDWDCLYALSQCSLVNFSGKDVASRLFEAQMDMETPISCETVDALPKVNL